MPIHHSLTHPGWFADEVQRVRNDLVHTPVTIEKIHVFRGQPRSKREVNPAARTNAQHAAWEKDRRVTVSSRTLRYPADWPDTPSREQGVDVWLAVTLMRASIEKWADVLILASRDTDLLPALEAARNIDGSIVEVAGWASASRVRRSHCGARLSITPASTPAATVATTRRGTIRLQRHRRPGAPPRDEDRTPGHRECLGKDRDQGIATSAQYE